MRPMSLEGLPWADTGMQWPAIARLMLRHLLGARAKGIQKGDEVEFERGRRILEPLGNLSWHEPLFLSIRMGTI